MCIRDSNETFEQIPLNESELGDAFKFVKENEVCKVLSYKGKVFGVEAPNFVVLEEMCIRDSD